MGGLSLWHWIVVIAIVMVLFGGRGKISDIMGDVAKGIKSFKKGMADEDASPAAPPAPPAQPVESVRAEAPIVIEHQREVEIPGAPAPKPRAKAAAKSPAKKAPAKAPTAKAATAKAPATKTAAKKSATSRKKADS